MNFRRTPATESSMIYGVALFLGFLFLAAFNGWGPAIALSQWLAFLLLLPTWIFQTLFARILKFRSKYRSFFVNVSVTSVLAIAGLILVQVILANNPTTPHLQRVEITNAFGMLVFVYFLTTTIASVLTQWVFFKNSDPVKGGKSEFGALPISPATPKKKKK